MIHVLLVVGSYGLFILGALVVTSAGCDSGAKLPNKASKEYNNVVSAFYVGLAALQVGLPIALAVMDFTSSNIASHSCGLMPREEIM